jgi:invasion protein IalB
MANMTTSSVLAGAGLIALGAIGAVGTEHLVLKNKDPRDAMTTVDTLGDWQMTCQPRTQKDGRCVMQQTIKLANGSVIAELSLAPDEKTKADSLTIVTPLGVLIPGGVKVVVGSNAPKAVDYKTCAQMGCIAVLPVDSALSDTLAHGGTAQLQVVNGFGKTVPIGFSLKGFADALAARETDMKARSNSSL